MLGDRFADVLQGARDGDVHAFAELWRETQPMLVRYLRVTAGQQAEDVASQTWLRVLDGLGSFSGGEPGFRRWVVTISHNIHVDECRRAGRRPEDLMADPVELDEPSATPGPAALVESRMSTRAALDLVATLPADQAEMVTLRVLVGMDVAEVATLVGRSPGAVRVAVHRALRTLRAQLVEPPWSNAKLEADVLLSR